MTGKTIGHFTEGVLGNGIMLDWYSRVRRRKRATPKAFECLVYLHRYNEGTLARMRTEYVTPLLGKYDATLGQLAEQIAQASSTAEANKLKKQQTVLEKKLTELRAFDDNLKHHADRRISLDLDDGVKVNYGKFGHLLAEVKAITGKKP